jgi:hypothetical protein
VVVLRWPVRVVPLCAGRAGMSPWLVVAATAVLPFTVVERITAVVLTMVLAPWLPALQLVPPLVRRRHPHITLQRRIIIPTTRTRARAHKSDFQSADFLIHVWTAPVEQENWRAF